LNMFYRFLAAFALFWLANMPAWSAPSFLLAKELPAEVNVRDYWVSEKYDGVRAHWDGKQLWTRGGQLINAPEWFIAGLPKVALDGELWIARGAFERVSGIVRQKIPTDDWRDVKYMIFELPNAQGDFSVRVAQIERTVAAANVPYLSAVRQYRVTARDQLQDDLDAIVKAGGEGLMLHLASALYVTGRSDVLYKLKPQQDAEATVIGHIQGQGKYANMLGALRVRADNGREFNIGTGLSDEVRRNPPPVGTLITYRYRGLTKNGLPRFASFWRVRTVS
jgi:DNA ligase 1